MVLVAPEVSRCPGSPVWTVLMPLILVGSPAQELTQDWPVDRTVCLEDMSWDEGSGSSAPLPINFSRIIVGFFPRHVRIQLPLWRSLQHVGGGDKDGPRGRGGGGGGGGLLRHVFPQCVCHIPEKASRLLTMRPATILKNPEEHGNSQGGVGEAEEGSWNRRHQNRVEKGGIVARKRAVGAAAAAPWRRGGFVQAGRRAAVHSGVLLTCPDLPPRRSAVT